jgi:hypothetical protein
MVKSGKFSYYTSWYALGDHITEICFDHRETGIRIDDFVDFTYAVDNNNVNFQILHDGHRKKTALALLYTKPYGYKTLQWHTDKESDYVIELKCPDELYLEQAYGKNWETPINYGEFDGYFGTLNSNYRPALLDTDETYKILNHKWHK